MVEVTVVEVTVVEVTVVEVTVVEVTVVEVTGVKVTVVEVTVVEVTVVEVWHQLVSPAEVRHVPSSPGPPGRLQHWLEDWSPPGGKVKKDYHTLHCGLCTWGYGEKRGTIFWKEHS